MNYLAHAWLARHSDDAILGALLGDFVFGQSTLREWPPAIRAEIVRDVGVHCDGVFVHLKLVGKQFSHLFEHNTVSS